MEFCAKGVSRFLSKYNNLFLRKKNGYLGSCELLVKPYFNIIKQKLWFLAYM